MEISHCRCNEEEEMSATRDDFTHHIISSRINKSYGIGAITEGARVGAFTCPIFDIDKKFLTGSIHSSGSCARNRLLREGSNRTSSTCWPIFAYDGGSMTRGKTIDKVLFNRIDGSIKVTVTKNLVEEENGLCKSTEARSFIEASKG
jgi:hypothetical protein